MAVLMVQDDQLMPFGCLWRDVRMWMEIEVLEHVEDGAKAGEMMFQED
jgi:hypothetical protein